MIYHIQDTPWGPFLMAADSRGLRVVDYQQGPKPRIADPSWQQDPERLARAGNLLLLYLKGERPSIVIPLCPQGTLFQEKVWNHLMTIPYGRTVSYQDVAQALGNPQSTRAVASAIGRNPIQIFIPCHRIIGKDGSLRGYAGGLALKQRLLDHEHNSIHSS